MASPAQILANRQNAQRSTGPKHRKGKQLPAATPLVTASPAHRSSSPEKTPPPTSSSAMGYTGHTARQEAERILVDQIAANAWRLMRAQRVETAFLAKLVEGAADPDTAIASPFSKNRKNRAHTPIRRSRAERLLQSNGHFRSFKKNGRSPRPNCPLASFRTTIARNS